MPSRGVGPGMSPRMLGEVPVEKGQAVCSRVRMELEQTCRGGPAEEECGVEPEGR